MNHETWTIYGNFSLKLPLDWEEYDDGEENTFAFFNTKYWTGNLRITPFVWPTADDGEPEKAAAFIQDELMENEGAVRLKIGDFDCAHYKKDIEQDGDKLIIYYWAAGKGNDLFMCSLTINKEQEQDHQHRDTLQLVQDIIASIKKLI